MEKEETVRTLIDSYEKKLKQKDKQIKELEKHNKWLIDKLNSIDIEENK